MEKIDMKYILKKITLITLLMATVLCVAIQPVAASIQDSSTSNSIYPLITDADYYPENYTGYLYPIRPGMIEWTKIETGEDMAKICQIPENTLAHLTIEELLQTVVAYPLASDIFLIDDPNEGILLLRTVFNGLDTLLDSSLDASVLLSYYLNEITAKSLLDQNSASRTVSNGVDYKQILVNRRTMFLEKLIEIPIFFEALSTEEKEYFFLCRHHLT